MADQRLLERHGVTQLTDIPMYASAHSDELVQMVIERGEEMRDIWNAFPQRLKQACSHGAAKY
ncbi:hypothetical protein VHEMI01249 [[Torrubiella] hemipterigena]|uniref:Uncharacterized protein n=1 Tax=[Torrubiella] hemipterigena TaxID=1531966 RepID=A0A0A1SLE4_9HYPO|nr:hypothetical protein VHEMI01249 [[Torrubiella] hemipterigena]